MFLSDSFSVFFFVE